MDQNLKQRLVGAVVITSLAAIFVPMLFDDPIDETGKMISELKIPDVPLTVINTPANQIPNSVDDVIGLPDPLGLQQQSTTKKLNAGLQRWFVQVGIFSQKENAINLQNKIVKQGFSVSIAEVLNEKGLFYRVRVGPALNKKKAETIKQKVDKLNNLKGIISSVDE